MLCVGLFGRGDWPIARPLPIKGSKTQKRRHKPMSQAGFEPTIPLFERLPTKRALDRAVLGMITVIFK